MKKSLQFIYAGFAISFIVTIIISIVYLEEFTALQKSNEGLERTYLVKNRILRVQSFLTEAENIQRGYLITEDKTLLGQLRKIQVDIFKEMEKLKELTFNLPEQQSIIVKLKELVSQRYTLLYQTADDANSSNLLVFLQNGEKGKQIMNRFYLLTNRMDEIETEILTKRKFESQTLQFVTSFYLKLTLILSILFQLFSFTLIIQAFKKRRIYQRILENKIKELNISHSEMEQIAFVASHDLQEPLRKIRTFSDKLGKNHAADLHKDGQKLIEKINNSSKTMQELLSDFISYTRLVRSAKTQAEVSLTKVVRQVEANFRTVIDLKKAVIIVDDLPEIFGYEDQLQLLFSSLIDNSLKFAKPGVATIINISAKNYKLSEKDSEKEYFEVVFSDNGIGFEKEFAEKIFIIFQRLHSQNSAYLGKGIGLAICKRVMINHDGFITAGGEPGSGATFHLFFPKNANL